MKLAIVGPRDLDLPVEEVARALGSLHTGGEIDLTAVTTIVTGDAMGVDRSAIRYAKKIGFPWVAFGAGWRMHKKGAGPERNARLVAYLDPQTDVLVALADRLGTPGTEDVTNRADKADVFTILHKDERWISYRRET